ncbi:putative phage major tail protein [Oenococcus oeni]|uniref:phage tail protein n=1 Tax=Oenococcus oeni TaxID=1247 RepID=UPI00107AC1E6|nr:phage tail protein [Oenococcus oeni]AVI94107.1 hypothetical protein AX764_04340 [Oenococcus oeni]SYV99693.1 putative phage major tail protein [Oenococcus oeni]SYW03871.1 putative phage major tail protein [Oenococcus oeni]SYW17649.1 putative phage major tail protein [Oenococcus oeni]VDC14626.1 putative phage major tail protein [Oenococcus oeni]
MATYGLSYVKLALLDDNDKIIAGADGLSTDGTYLVDAGLTSTKTANITGLENTPVAVAGNNKTVDYQIISGVPSIALDFNDLPIDIANKVLGKTSDGKGGYTLTGEKPHVALLLACPRPDKVHNVFYGFGKGILTEPSKNNGTNTETAITASDDEYTFSSIAVSRWANANIKFYFDEDTNFDENTMLADVFDGWVAPTTTGTTQG